MVAGTKFRIGFQKYSNDSSIRYALFEVFVGLDRAKTVKEVACINFSGYSVEQIIEAYNSALELHPEVNVYTGYVLTRI